jgi:hypothetical protein
MAHERVRRTREDRVRNKTGVQQELLHVLHVTEEKKETVSRASYQGRTSKWFW